MMSVRQSQITTPARSGFAFSVWVGTIGGAALAADANPNTTPPSAGRIVRLGPRRGGTYATGGFAQATGFSFCILFVPIAAGAITVQVWLFDSTQNLWVQYGAPIALTPNAVGALNTNTPSFNPRAIGAQAFVQVTANANVQAFAYDGT